MALTFTNSPLVAAGQRITSAEHIKQAKAFNDRLRSGLGDGTYRLHYGVRNFWLQTYNPDGELFAAQQRFQQYEVHLDRDNTEQQWPAEGAGLPAGANLANPANEFVFGNPQISSEQDRLNGLEGMRLDKPHDYDEAFTLGQQQRGAFDPTTGALGCPAFTAAQSFYQIVQPFYSPMGKKYGGFMPIPELIGTCGDGVGDTPDTNKYQIVFTPLRTGLPIKYYTGYCPNGDNTGGLGAGASIIFISRTPFAYYVYFPNGTNERLDKKDYIEGPYSGGASLFHNDGEMVARMINKFVGDWRGTRADRSGTAFDIEQIAFHLQKFFTRQYFLSPNIGHVVGDEIFPDYPTFTFGPAGTIPQGFLTGTHSYTAGFVLAGIRLRGTKLITATQVSVLSGTNVLTTISLQPDSSGNAVAVKWFIDGPVPNPLQFRLEQDANFSDATGTIICEATEQLAYKPELHDAYLVLRCSASQGADDEFDIQGRNSVYADEIFTNYTTLGCISNIYGKSGISGSQGSLNINPVIDSMRRLTRDNLRVVPRDQFVGYELADGKSVLYFKRYALGDKNNRADSFDNIAGAIDLVAPTGISAGIKYRVRSGSINYNQNTYAANDSFFGVQGISSFTGDGAEVIEDTRILPIAPPQGFTNEWLMFPQFKVASTDENDTSIFKPGAYADFFDLCERCHFYAPFINETQHPDLLNLFNYGLAPMLNPHSPTGWRYARGTNQPGQEGLAGVDWPSFYKSCRIYEPDAEIETALEFIENGESIIKITFKTRLHHCADAVGTIPRDVLQWDVAALNAEPYRSVENGLRMYLLRQGRGLQAPRGMTGDTAASTEHTRFFWNDFDGVFGAVMPTFFFTRLIPEPFEDTPPNETVEKEKDAIITFDRFNQMELYASMMCEGFIDGTTSVNYACTSGVADMWDYTWENICFDADKQRSLGLLQTSRRPDLPVGYGPLPCTEIDAERFNRMSKILNKMTKVRVMLPFKFQCRATTRTHVYAITPNIWNPNGACIGAGVNKAISHESPIDGADTTVTDDWADCNGIGASASASLTDSCIGGDFAFQVVHRVGAFRFELTDPDAINAVPEAWRDMLQSPAAGFIGYKTVLNTVPFLTEVGTLAESDGCCLEASKPCPGFFWDPGLVKGWTFGMHETTTTTCELITSGEIDPGGAPSGDFYIGRAADGAVCANASTNGIGINPIVDNPAMFIEVPLA